MKKEEFVTVLTTCDDREVLAKIALQLVEKKLAACVQVFGPIESTYCWQGKVEKATEWLCLIKTTRFLYGEVQREILEAHPYETPEIIALPVIEGSRDYLSWIKASVIS